MDVAKRTLLSLMCCLMLAPQSSAYAQDADTEARQHFELGRQAFELAQYETAMQSFERAYKLSGRAELLYNLAMTSDRMNHKEKAVDLYKQYLSGTKTPERRAQVEQRIVVLEQDIAQAQAAKQLLASRRTELEIDKPEPQRTAKPAVVGPVILGVAGLGGVAAMIAGIAQNGQCTTRECTHKKQTGAGAWVWGGAGVAAIVGASTWFAVSKRKARKQTQVGVGPTTIQVRGSF